MDLPLKTLFLLSSLLLCIQGPLKGQQDGFQAKIGMEYMYLEYGKLHGAQLPFALSYQIGNLYAGASVGLGVGVSSWNYEGDSDKFYNLDIDQNVPPWAFWKGSTFQGNDRLIMLKGGTGYAVRFFNNLHIGKNLQLWDRPLSVEAGAYLTRVTTSFMAAKAEDVQVYNAFGTNAPNAVYPTDLLFPVSVIYWDYGPFLALRYQLTKNWRIPIGLSTAYYHGSYDNSVLSIGLYFYLPMGSEN